MASRRGDDGDQRRQQGEIDAEEAVSADALWRAPGAALSRHLDRREAALDEREQELDHREAALEERETALRSRDAAFQHRQLQADRRDQQADQREINAQTVWPDD